MSELLVREASSAAPLQTSERIKLGRILHLDRSVTQSPRAWWEAHLIFHGIFVSLVGLCVLGIHGEPENGALWLMLNVIVLTWIGTTFIMELLIRQNATFELQLLPSGVRLTNLDGTVELVEPEIVGGKWSRWWQLIKLREGSKETMIPLSRFRHRHERAAIIEHCSQFLSPKQQAEFGPEWTRAFYELITPPKPKNLRQCLVACAQAYGCVCFIEAGVIEGILIAYPDATTVNGASLRWGYVALAMVPLVFIGPISAAHCLERWLRRMPAEEKGV